MQRRFHANNHGGRKDGIFVFGSNLAGIHGGGAAYYAAQRLGAEAGVGIGRTGFCYALPTKDATVRNSLSLEQIRGHVQVFLLHAKEHQDQQFFVTRVGCGLAGYTDDEIGPMFALAPMNCVLPPEWRHWSARGESYLAALQQCERVMQYAFQHGYHELGIRPLEELLRTHRELVRCGSTFV